MDLRGNNSPNACHHVVPDMNFSVAGNIWAGISDPHQRRRLQNRVNQQTRRRRKTSLEQSRGARRSRNSDSLQDERTSALRPLLPKVAELLQSIIKESEMDDVERVPSPSTGEHLIPTFRRHMQCNTASLRSIQLSLDPRSAIQPALNEAPIRDIFNYASAVGRSALHDPVVFHGVLVGGAGQRSSITKNPRDIESFIAAEANTGKTVREALARGRFTDGLLWAIMRLAARPNSYVHSISAAERYTSAFESPVRNIGGMQWTGLIEPAPEHTAIDSVDRVIYGSSRCGI
ncbi:hypothetical protein SCUP234_09576 [Seiridium cupressi]